MADEVAWKGTWTSYTFTIGLSLNQRLMHLFKSVRGRRALWSCIWVLTRKVEPNFWMILDFWTTLWLVDRLFNQASRHQLLLLVSMALICHSSLYWRVKKQEWSSTRIKRECTSDHLTIKGWRKNFNDTRTVRLVGILKVNCRLVGACPILRASSAISTD